jgi:hypothetical protein
MRNRLARRQSIKPASRQRKPARNRVARFLLVTLGSGGAAAVIAIVVAGMQALVTQAFPGQDQIAAGSLFPPVPAQHRTVNVYDPPTSRPPAPPTSKPSPTPAPSPRPSPSRSPRPTPSGGD